jgi:hypothetical protein
VARIDEARVHGRASRVDHLAAGRRLRIRANRRDSIAANHNRARSMTGPVTGTMRAFVMAHAAPLVFSLISSGWLGVVERLAGAP